jgi:serine O-acetyltransferase
MRLADRHHFSRDESKSETYQLLMIADPDYLSDLKRYPRRPFLKEQSVWAIWVYRFGRRLLAEEPSLIRAFKFRIYWSMFRFIETTTGISISLDARIGPGLRIFHFGNIFVHSEAVIGRNCTLRQGVTIGSVDVGGQAPKIGDDVEFGAYAQAIGNIRIGSGARIGAMSLVMSDVPSGATAIGVPARIVATKGVVGKINEPV